MDVRALDHDRHDRHDPLLAEASTVHNDGIRLAAGHFASRSAGLPRPRPVSISQLGVS